MKFQIIAIYRKNHQSHLTKEDIAFVREIAQAVGVHSQVVWTREEDKKEETVRVHKHELKAPSAEKAMEFYGLDNPGAEILSCEVVEEKEYTPVKVGEGFF